MNKYAVAFALLFVSSMLSGCNSDVKKRANAYATKAFEALVKEVDNPIEVDSAKWICYEILNKDHNTEIGCSYYIIFAYQGSSIERYAAIGVEEVSWTETITTRRKIERTSELLDARYYEDLAWAQMGEVVDPEWILSITFEKGHLNKREIARALPSRT